MRTRATIGLASLFTTLLQGCSDNAGDDDGSCRASTESYSETIVVPGDQFVDGFTCRVCPGTPVSCADLGPTGDVSTGGSGGIGGGISSGGAGGLAAGGAGGLAAGGAGGLAAGGAGGLAAGGAGGTIPSGPPHEVRCDFEVRNYCGRRHASVSGPENRGGPSEVAAWLAHAASMERISVDAFSVLHDELAALGAPSELCTAARAAAQDEAHHTAIMSRLARNAGAAPGRPPKVDVVPRTLLELARENAVEGCVYETYSALTAMHQARHAEDTAVQEAMVTIERDELRHGELAWQIHRWACTKLSEDEVAAVEQAMHDAANALVRGVAEERLSNSTCATLGLPSARRAAELAKSVRRVLWS